MTHVSPETDQFRVLIWFYMSYHSVSALNHINQESFFSWISDLVSNFCLFLISDYFDTKFRDVVQSVGKICLTPLPPFVSCTKFPSYIRFMQHIYFKAETNTRIILRDLLIINYGLIEPIL